MKLIWAANIVYLFAYAMHVGWMNSWFEVATLNDIVWWTAVIHQTFATLAAGFLLIVMTGFNVAHDKNPQSVTASAPVKVSRMQLVIGAVITMGVMYVYHAFGYELFAYWAAANWVLAALAISSLLNLLRKVQKS